MSDLFDQILSEVQRAERELEAEEQSKFTASTETLSCCPECDAHFYRECNLCGEITFCEKCGCYLCELKVKNDAGSLSATPDVEREILLTITEREANLPKQKKPQRTKNAKRFRNHRNLKEAWLDDLIAAQ